MYQEYFNFIQEGWRCPQCKSILAPHISFCPYCNAERKTFATTLTDKTTITPFDDKGWWEDYQRRATVDVEALNQLLEKQFTTEVVATSVAASNIENKLNNNSITTCPQKCEICDNYGKSCFGGIETTSNKAIISHRKPLEVYCDYDYLDGFIKHFQD